MPGFKDIEVVRADLVQNSGLIGSAALAFLAQDKDSSDTPSNSHAADIKDNGMLTIKRLGLDDARALIAGAKVKAEEIGVPMCIAVTDESGQLIAFERMDGGKITSTLIAQDKAFTAAGAKRTTESYGEASQPESRPMVSTLLSAAICRLSRAGSWSSSTAVVGAVGVSSGTPAQDSECAAAAIEHFLKPLA